MDSPRSSIAEALRGDAVLHESGRFQEIGAGYDATQGRILPLEESRERDVDIAFAFWDGWIDASNHNWQYYEGIAQSDWPNLARAIAIALEARHPIADPIVLAHFAPENQRSLWSRFKSWLGGQDSP